MKTRLTPSEVMAASNVETPIILEGYQASVATGTLAGMLARRKMVARGLRVRILDCGSANTTTVNLQIDGTTRASVSIANTATNGAVVVAGYAGTGAISSSTDTDNVAAVAQVETITAVDNDDGEYTVTINGNDYDFTASTNTAAEIIEELTTLIVAGEEPVTVTNPTSTSIRLTANEAGTPFTIAVNSPSSDLTVVQTTANVEAVAQIDLIEVAIADPDVDYVATLNGSSVRYTATSTDTITTIRDELITLLADLGEAVTVEADDDDTITVTADEAGTAFTLSVSCAGGLPIAVDSIVTLTCSAAATAATGMAASAILVQDFS